MEENIILEEEMDMPEDWVSNQIFIRDGKGNMIEVIIPDDIKEG